MSRRTRPEDLPSHLPALPYGWNYSPLGSLVDFRGISYGVVQPGMNNPDGVPIVRVNNLKEGRIITADVMRIHREIEEKYHRSRLRGGEVLISLVGSVGECAVVPRSLVGWNVARAVGVISPIDGIAPEWIALALRSAIAQHFIRSWVTTTVQATLNLRDVSKLPIPIAPPQERKAIARILGALDDKIELNRRMSQTMELMAREIFNSWFVDFAPAVDGQPWSQKRGSIGDLATITREALSPGDYPEELFNHYSIPAFDEGQTPRAERGDGIKSNKFLVPAVAVLLSKLNPRIPRVWLPSVSAEARSICSTEFLVMVPREVSDREYLYSLFCSSDFMDRFAARTTGTSSSHQRVRPEDLLRMGVAVPSSTARERFSATVGPLFGKVAQNLQESRVLATLRDALLPKLLSGEIRVKQARKIVGEAL